jgi:hypothetical protein
LLDKRGLTYTSEQKEKLNIITGKSNENYIKYKRLKFSIRRKSYHQLAEQHFFERAAGMNQTGKFLARPIR